MSDPSPMSDSSGGKPLPVGESPDDAALEEDAAVLLDRAMRLMEAFQKLTPINETFTRTMRDSVDAQKRVIANMR